MDINEQVKELRKAARWFEGTGLPEAVKLANEAADTIEFLSAKMQAANKEIEALNIIKEIGDEVAANLEWTYCRDGNNLPTEPFGCIVTVIDTEPMTQTDYESILPYHVGYDGKQWNDIEGNQIPFEVIAWRPAPREPYHEP